MANHELLNDDFLEISIVPLSCHLHSHSRIRGKGVVGLIAVEAVGDNGSQLPMEDEFRDHSRGQFLSIASVVPHLKNLGIDVTILDF